MHSLPPPVPDAPLPTEVQTCLDFYNAEAVGKALTLGNWNVNRRAEVLIGLIEDEKVPASAKALCIRMLDETVETALKCAGLIQETSAEITLTEGNPHRLRLARVQYALQNQSPTPSLEVSSYARLASPPEDDQPCDASRPRITHEAPSSIHSGAGGGGSDPPGQLEPPSEGSSVSPGG